MVLCDWHTHFFPVYLSGLSHILCKTPMSTSVLHSESKVPLNGKDRYDNPEAEGSFSRTYNRNSSGDNDENNARKQRALCFFRAVMEGRSRSSRNMEETQR